MLSTDFPAMTPHEPRLTSPRKVLEDLSKALSEDEIAKGDQPKTTRHQRSSYTGLLHIMSTAPGNLTDAINRRIAESEPYDDGRQEQGFRHYRRGSGENLWEYIVPESAVDDQLIFFECLAGSSCTARTHLGDRIGLAYRIPREEIPMWRTVDGKVREMVRGFVLGCFVAPRLEPGDNAPTPSACPF